MDNVIEKKFLAYLMYDKKYISKAINTISITPKHLPTVYKVYKLVAKYFVKYGVIISDDAINSSFKKNKIDDKTIVTYKSIFSDIKYFNTDEFSDGEFESICDELEDNYKRLEVLELAESIITKGSNCSEKAFDELKTQISKLSVSLNTNKSNIKEEGSIQERIKVRKERYEEIKNNPSMIVTYPTGFTKIDDESGGFAPSELIYIIGRKGDGKSVLMLNLAHNMWKKGLNVILFSLEVPQEAYERRFDARAAGVSSNGLKFGKLSDEEEEIYNDYLQKLSEGLSIDGDKVGAMYIIDVPSMCTPSFLSEKVKEVELKLGITFQVVISDYAGIMQPDMKFGELRLDQAEIALELKQYARTTDKVVITAAQMNRIGKNQKKTETDAIAESDAIADHIDWGIAIRKVSDDVGIMESFKTRDAAPFEFHFNRKFSKMLIEELDDDIQQWDSV
jgi:replicative DNA helicase